MQLSYTILHKKKADLYTGLLTAENGKELLKVKEEQKKTPKRLLSLRRGW